MSYKDTPQPGEWQTEVNPYGGVRRYRMIGNCKEYEMMVTVDGMRIPQSEVKAYHERKRQREAAQRIQATQIQQPPPQNCPFTSGLNTDCRREKCALFLDGCTLAKIGNRQPAKDTKGLQCPFNHCSCNEQCALYKGGCTLTAVNND